jgi:hypothetical protein
MPIRSFVTLASAVMAAGFIASACSSDCPNCPGDPALLLISPGSPSVLPGRQVKLATEVLDAKGRLLAGNPATWEALDQAVASVDDTGLVSGLAVGAGRIVARAAGLTDTATVAVVNVSTFSAQVYPILAANCALGGCHVVPGPNPNLSTQSAAFTALLDPSIPRVRVFPGDTVGGELLRRLRGDTILVMPPQGALDSLQRGNYDLITLWIAQGALNN